MGATLGVMLLLGAAAAITTALGGFRRRPGRPRDDTRLVRRATEAPKVTIAAARDGELVRIVGVIEPGGSTLLAPLSGRRGVGYELVVSEPKTGGVWEHARDGVDFVVDDGTGRARAVMGGAALLLALEPVPPGGPALRELLVRKHLTDVDTAAVEGVLVAGTRVAVVGKAFWERDASPARPGATYRGSAEPRRLAIVAHGPTPVLVTNVPDLLG